MKKGANIFLLLTSVAFAAVVSFSCRSTRYVPEGDYLLRKNKIEINNSKIDKSNVELYVKQHQNKSSLLGLKLGLGVYNFSGRDTTKFNKWMKKIGEAPVVFDKSLVDVSSKNISEYLRQLGYYESSVSDTVFYRNRKAKPVYTIKVGEPLRIGALSYDISDTVIRNYIYADTSKIHIRKGDILSTVLLDDERDQITSRLRNMGFYDFNKTSIKFTADSTKGRDSVLLKMRVENPTILNESGTRVPSKYKQYVIKDVFIYTRYDGTRAYINKHYGEGFDTVYVDGIHIVYRRKQNIDKDLFKRMNLIEPGTLYSEQNVTQTYTNFNSLNLFRTQRIEFVEVEKETAENGKKELVCNIYLTPQTTQGYGLGLELSTNSAGYWGISPSVSYIHRNLFKGAERFELSFSGLYQRRIPRKEGYESMKEFNINASLSVPKFMMPIRINYFKRHVPQTKITANYTHQQRLVYKRTVVGASYGYAWKSSQYTTFQFKPIDLSIIKIRDIDSIFYASIKNPYVRNLYENHVILGANFSVENSNRFLNISSLAYYLHLNLDFGGNFLSLFNSFMKKDNYGNYEFLGTPYSQYAKLDLTFTLNQKIDRNNSFVVRFYGGIGKAYGNSTAMPLEKMFYSGGANSLRGWQMRAVGPGSVETDTILRIPYQIADFKLEFNAELRFKVIGMLEGALFYDVGNIWTLDKKDTREGARFKFNTFFKTVASDVGVGARLNFGILTLRLDWGFRLHDPARIGSRFVPVKDWLHGGNNTVHFGINYPF